MATKNCSGASAGEPSATRTWLCKPRKGKRPASASSTEKREREEHAREEHACEKRALMTYCSLDYHQRAHYSASVRSLLDRKKYYRDFHLRVDANGAGKIIKVSDGARTTRALVATMTPRETRFYLDNPHLHQVFANGRTFLQEQRVLSAADRVIRFGETPRVPYQRRFNEVKTVEHWGQRKLLLSEIEFLTLHSAPGDKVVYAGAAPGNHIKFLAERLFPELTWVLVDPRAFAFCETPTITLKRAYFDDALAETLRGENVLFICDIRSDSTKEKKEDMEERVQSDMAHQMRWVQIMRPKASMLKFRLPYYRKDDTVLQTATYLKGQLFFPVWGGRTTTETRLVVTDPVCNSVSNALLNLP